jgi:hypothetical protein
MPAASIAVTGRGKLDVFAGLCPTGPLKDLTCSTKLGAHALA